MKEYRLFKNGYLVTSTNANSSLDALLHFAKSYDMRSKNTYRIYSDINIVYCNHPFFMS